MQHAVSEPAMGRTTSSYGRIFPAHGRTVVGGIRYCCFLHAQRVARITIRVMAGENEKVARRLKMYTLTPRTPNYDPVPRMVLTMLSPFIFYSKETDPNHHFFNGENPVTRDIWRGAEKNRRIERSSHDASTLYWTVGLSGHNIENLQPMLVGGSICLI